MPILNGTYKDFLFPEMSTILLDAQADEASVSKIAPSIFKYLASKYQLVFSIQYH